MLWEEAFNKLLKFTSPNYWLNMIDGEAVFEYTKPNEKRWKGLPAAVDAGILKISVPGWPESKRVKRVVKAHCLH